MTEAAPQVPHIMPTTTGMTTKVVKGSFWTLAGQILPLGVSLIATPFVIRLLGNEGYGVLLLVSLIPSYLGFSDLGMGIASTRFGSEAYAANDAENEALIVRTAAFIAFVAALPTAIVLIAFSGTIIGFFKVPDHLQLQAELALKIAALTFLVNFLNNIFNTPQLSRLRMDLNTFVTTGFRALGIVATPIVLYLGGGIVGAVATLFIASVLTLVGHLFVSRRLLPSLIAVSIDPEMIRPLVKFGGALSISAIAGIVLTNAEKGMISAIVSPEALAYYYIAFVLVNMMTMFSGAMVQSLLPAFSQLQGDDCRTQLNTLYSRGIRINLIVLVPILLFVSLVARPFFTVWAGIDFGRESVTPFYIMLSGIVIGGIAFFPNAAILASGRTDIIAKLYWLEVLPYLLLVGILTFELGITGAAIAWSLRVIFDAAIMFMLAKSVSGLSFIYRRPIPFLVAILIMLIPFVMNLYLQELTPIVIISALVATGFYVVLIWRNILEAAEISWLMQKFWKRAIN